MREEAVSNANILKAINRLYDRFSKFKEMVHKNTAVQDHLKCLEMQNKETEVPVKKLKDLISTPKSPVGSGTSIC